MFGISGIALKAYICFCILVFIFLAYGLYKLSIEEYIGKRIHEYSTPPGLQGNTQWLKLLEEWKNLTKLNSWTSKYAIAEEKYKFRMRTFLQSGFDKSKYTEIPIVAVCLQARRILIDNHYDPVGNLDWKKANRDSGYIFDALLSGGLPPDIEKVVREINDAYSDLDKKGVEFASEKLSKVHDKIAKLPRHKYPTPKALEFNTTWHSLLEDWEQLTKLDSWTPEYKIAEEKYKFKFREFLKSDLDNPKYINIPIVALKLQYVWMMVREDSYLFMDLDDRKSSEDNKYISDIVFSDEIPGDVRELINKISQSYYLKDKKGTKAAKKAISDIHSEITAMSR